MEACAITTGKQLLTDVRYTTEYFECSRWTLSLALNLARCALTESICLDRDPYLALHDADAVYTLIRKDVLALRATRTALVGYAGRDVI